MRNGTRRPRPLASTTRRLALDAGILVSLLLVGASAVIAQGPDERVQDAARPTVASADNTAPLAPVAEDAVPPAAPDDAAPMAASEIAERRQYAGPEPDQVFFEAYWDLGIKYRLLGHVRLKDQGRFVGPYLTREPAVTGELGFKLQVDAAAYVEADDLEQIDDRIALRRGFMTARGTFFNFIYPIDFSVEMGGISKDFFVNEAFLRLNDLPYLGSFKAGHYTAPLSFQSMMSSRDVGLMESASPVQAFSPGTLAGAHFAAEYDEPRVSWALGFFTEGQDGEVGDASEDFGSVVTRFTWVPLRPEAGKEPVLLHLGLGGSYLFSAADSIRYQSRPESFLAPFAIDTGVIDANSALVINAEAAFVKGPLSGQFEYFQATAAGDGIDTVTFPGVYLQLNGFLTGEHRPYDYRNRIFGQVLPHRPLSICNRTWGAWEWGGRYSYTNLEDGSVQGGRMHSLTAGMNWYWNRYFRMQFNYGFSVIDEGVLDGRLNTFQMRFQFVV